MILEEYSAELAKRMDRLIVPEIFTPYHVRVLWARIYNSEDLCFEISPDVHRHFFYEIHCVLDGQLTYECEGQSYVLTPNTGILLSPNTSHICQASGAHFLRYSFAFTIEEDSRLANFLSQKPIWFFPTDESLLTNVKTILHETGQSTSFSLPIIQGRMLEIFHSVTKVLQYASYKEDLFEGNTDSRVSIAKVYIRMNANKNLSCSEVAHECGVSGKHLNRLFLKYTNQSLHSYIIQTRIKKAEKLLLNPNLTIKEISMMMGFENEYYFRDFFKRHRGIPPALFRKNYAK